MIGTTESENKRRGITISLVFHSLILLLGVIPFLVQLEFPPVKERAIVIEFEDNASTKSGSSSSAARARASRQKVAMAAMPTKAITPAIKPPVTPKPVITSPNPDITVPPPKDTYFEDALEHTEQDMEVVEELEVVEETPVENVFETWAISESDEMTDAPEELSSGEEYTPVTLDEFFEGAFPGEGDDGEEDMVFFDSDWPGEGEGEGEGESDSGSGSDGGSGEGDKGSDTGKGNGGKGQWGDLAGDGLFNRKVIKRANVGRIARQNGRIVIDLCVDKSGKVQSAVINSGRSTISTSDIITKAEQCAMQYVFDQDATAPEQQCGRLTFVFKIDR